MEYETEMRIVICYLRPVAILNFVWNVQCAYKEKIISLDDKIECQHFCMSQALYSGAEKFIG